MSNLKPSSGTGVDVGGLGLGVAVGGEVGGRDVGVDEGVVVGVAVGVPVGVLVGVRVAVWEGVGVAVAVGVGVGEAVGVAVRVKVAVGARVGERVGLGAVTWTTAAGVGSGPPQAATATSNTVKVAARRTGWNRYAICSPSGQVGGIVPESAQLSMMGVCRKIESSGLLRETQGGPAKDGQSPPVRARRDRRRHRSPRRGKPPPGVPDQSRGRTRREVACLWHPPAGR